jgi:hypothetical protein
MMRRVKPPDAAFLVREQNETLRFEFAGGLALPS